MFQLQKTCDVIDLQTSRKWKNMINGRGQTRNNDDRFSLYYDDDNDDHDDGDDDDDDDHTNWEVVQKHNQEMRN